MTFRPISPFSNPNSGFVGNIIFPNRWPISFWLILWSYISALYITVLDQVSQTVFFYISIKNMSTPLFFLSFNWKGSLLHTWFKGKILSLKGTEHPLLFFGQFDSLSVKIKITKTTALLTKLRIGRAILIDVNGSYSYSRLIFLHT